MKDLTKINTAYAKCCNDYIKLFCEKQGIEFDFWIADKVGEIASFIQQYYFTLSDIIFDLNTDQPKGLILEYQDYNVSVTSEFAVNYQTFVKTKIKTQ